ncbi:hypothetical protein FQZ97_1100340 [compost metagenome]
MSDLPLRTCATHCHAVGTVGRRIGAQGHAVGVGCRCVAADRRAVVPGGDSPCAASHGIVAASHRLGSVAGVAHLEHAVGTVTHIVDVRSVVGHVAGNLVDTGVDPTGSGIQLVDVDRIGTVGAFRHIGDLPFVAGATDRDSVALGSDRAGP